MTREQTYRYIVAIAKGAGANDSRIKQWRVTNVPSWARVAVLESALREGKTVDAWVFDNFRKAAHAAKAAQKQEGKAA